jgi:putative ABC transport system permease protein
MVIGEALLVGAVSVALGLLVGIAMGQAALRLVTRTINDLFFVVTVQSVEIPTISLVKGAVVGLFATLASAAIPAWEAASVSPRAAMSRSGLEEKAQRLINYAAVGGLVVILVGAILLFLSTDFLAFSFIGTLAVVVGFAMLTPLSTCFLMGPASRLTGLIWGTLGRMAPREVVNSISRTSVAVASLMVAVSVIIGVSLMVSSFRFTVITWLSQTLQGDVYISPPSLTAVSNPSVLAPEVLDALQGWPGVAQIDSVRSVNVDSPNGPINVAAVNNPNTGQERLYLEADGSPEEINAAMQNGAIIISEPLANRLELPRNGGTLELFTDQGPQEFPIVGIYYDYASSQGSILMDQLVYRNLWNDGATTAVALRLNPGVDPDEMVGDLQGVLTPIQELLIRPNQALRDEVLEVFDRTFDITSALQLLATIVAFIGVLSALLSLQLEKQQQLGIMRAVGLTVRQMWQLVLLETGLMGAVAGLLAMPTGFVLSLILIYIINRRSFGWTLQFKVIPEPFLQALAVAVIAALLAGLYPAWRMSKRITADAIRFE